ncbi:MAG: ABC transporter substrate-binding protein [Desertimonas sp.]
MDNQHIDPHGGTRRSTGRGPRSGLRRRDFLFGAGAAAAAFAAGGNIVSAGSRSPSGTSGPRRATAAGRAGTPRGAEPTTGGTLRVGIVGSTNDIIDAQTIVAKADQARLVTGWESLVNYDADFNVSYEHGLAEEVEVKAADLYVVRLKEGIEFHNGKTVTADDVIYSYNRRLDPTLGLSPSLPLLLDSSGLTKVDDRTVEIQLKQPAVTFLTGMAEYTSTIVPDGYSREDAEQIGTGPFVLQSFTPGAESVHVRNPNYWGTGMPYLDEVQIIDFADSNALVNALQSGEVDCIVDVPFSQAGTITATDGIELLESQAGSWLTITMAIDQAPFDDVRVRQAMRLIVDREQMVQRVLSGYGSVGNDMYGVLDASYPSDFPQRTQDIDAAVALLEEAGQAGLEIDLFAPDDTAGLPELITAFAEQAKAAGITVNARVLDGGEYWGDQYTKRTFASSYWATRPYLNQVAAGSLKDASYPETHWPPEGSDFEELYLQALAETDDDARNAIIREMQQQEYDEGGNIVSVFNNLLDGHADHVHGFESRPNALNLDHFGRGFKNVWLDT